MMNRPRPRKIVSVIKTSPSAETVEEKPISISQNFNAEKKLSNDTFSNDFKPQSPVVPAFSSGPTRPSTTDTKPSVSPQQNQTATAFVPRKPVVATLKKAHVPPPPTFSDSPKSSPVPPAKTENFELEKSQSPNFLSTSSTEGKPLSPRSSGEAFLDAADKAADFIGGALLNSFKSFNLADTTAVKISSSKESETKDNEDPFADIMKKLKSGQTSNSSINGPVSNIAKKLEFTSLMDEEPPETFKQFNETNELPSKSPIKHKQTEPSSFIKAAFSPKTKEEPVKVPEKESEIIKEEKISVVVSEPIKFNHEPETIDAELHDDLKMIDEHFIEHSNEIDNVNVSEIETVNVSEINNVNISEIDNVNISKIEEETDAIIEKDSVLEKEFLFEDTKVETNILLEPKVENIIENDITNDDVISYEEEESPSESPRENPSQSTSQSTIESTNEDSRESTSEDSPVYQSMPQPVYPSFPAPIINFDGSVSSGVPSQFKIDSIEQVSSSSTIPFFDSLSSIISSTSSNSDSSSPSSPTTSSIQSPTSPQQPKPTGFRASILKHGLSALEKIGKSTAEVVVSTRNKLAEPSMGQITPSQQQPITPDFTDENSSFYDILKLYGGYTKLQELQLKGVKASISMKLARKSDKNKIEKVSSFDYQSRLKIRKEISNILHPDKIMDLIDDNDPSNLLFLKSFDTKFPIFSKFDDEIYCIQKLLKSLDNILIISDDEEVLISSNRRRHIICQISTVFATLLQQLTAVTTYTSTATAKTVTTSTATSSTSSTISPTPSIASSIETSKEISIFTAQIIKYLQTNFSRNCDDFSRADRDQQLAIKLFLDMAYSIVPQLQTL